MTSSGIAPQKAPADDTGNTDESPSRVREQVSQHARQTAEKVEAVRRDAVLLHRNEDVGQKLDEEKQDEKAEDEALRPAGFDDRRGGPQG